MTNAGRELCVGVDLGTQGPRVVIADAAGQVVGTAKSGWPIERADGRHEQDPERWRRKIQDALRQAVNQVKSSRRGEIGALAVTSTSGTIVATDAEGAPLRPAIMYDDRRADAEAKLANEAGAELIGRLGYRFRASFGLPKVLWLARNEPATWQACRHVAHAADWVTARVSGEWTVSDHTNVLKTGYDLQADRWPDFLDGLGVPIARLPRVLPTGTAIATVCAAVADACGLPAGVVVAAGPTDSNAAQIAAGASAPGQWSSALGSSLALKGVSEQLIRDPAGALYCHRHPQGWWLPGGASGVGGSCLNEHFDPGSFDRLDAEVAGRGPSGILVYPLVGTGDWFPFWADEAAGFELGDPADEADRYAGYLEGVALVERMAYDTVAALGAPVEGAIRITGGGSAIEVWRQIRADILGRGVVQPAVPEAAIVAASAHIHPGLAEAVAAMVHLGEPVAPRAERVEHYDSRCYRTPTEALADHHQLPTAA